MTLDFVGGP